MSVRFYAADHKVFGPGIAQLLHRVQKYHSLRAAALSMDMAYSKAWTVLRTAEEQLGFKLLHSSTGGKGGGGAVLSPEGELLLERYDELCRRIQAYGAQQYAETLLKKDKNLENDWLIGDESWRVGNKNTFQIRLTYYADADDAKEGRESEYQYKIHFDDVDGYVIKSEGVPEKEIVFPENK